MRALIQRVARASVTVDGDVISSIGKGLCVLVGITHADTDREIEWLVRKLLNLRVFSDSSGAGWSKSVSDLNLEVLCVSQFTLYGVLKGNKPDFHNAMGSEKSREFYLRFVEEMKKAHRPGLVKDGLFGAMMEVNIVNDGPVTLHIESNLPPAKERKPQGPQKKVKDAKDVSEAVAANAAACAGEEMNDCGASAS